MSRHPFDDFHAPQTGMAFLSENPEAFGFIADAHPIAMGDILVAAGGHSAEAGAISPSYPVEAGGVEGLLSTLYSGIIPHTAAAEAIMRATFGESEGEQEHPISRYSSALAEAIALQVMDGPARGASFEQTALLLGNEIAKGLDALRSTVSGDSMFTAIDEDELFSVSLGICRLSTNNNEDFAVDIFTAGDFRIFLVDSQGMCPLWSSDASTLSPDDPRPLDGRTWHLYHPEPFAILLLSGNLSDAGMPDARRLRESPNLIWRYRLRLEESILRLITAGIHIREFGERAARYFTGRTGGSDSATGAMLLSSADEETFRSLCSTRLRRVEDMVDLLPEGYDPTNTAALPTRLEVEETYIRRLFEREAGLSTRVADALREAALQKLAGGAVIEASAPDAPDYRRLTYADVAPIYRLYDAENDEDRARVAANRRFLAEQFAEHWVTLRPLFISPDGEASLARERAERTMDACLSLNARLGAILTTREGYLDALEICLSDALDTLHAERADWLSGRVNATRPSAFARALNESMGKVLAPLLATSPEADAYPALLVAYMTERDQLFRADVSIPGGQFAADWQLILSGRYPEFRWNTVRDTLAVSPGTAAYADLLDALWRISLGTGALESRMAARAADRRMAREIASDDAWRMAAVRASAYEDCDWGEAVVAILDPVRRSEYHAALRRHRDACDLAARRRAAYEKYHRMYEAYIVN